MVKPLMFDFVFDCF